MIHSLLNSQEYSPLVDFSAVINETKYSSLTRLLRISSYVLRYIRNLKAELSDNTNQERFRERLIQSVKRYHKKTVESTSLDYDELKTLKTSHLHL